MKMKVHNNRIIATRKKNMALRKKNMALRNKYSAMCKKSLEMLEENIGAMIDDIENGNGDVVMRQISLMTGQFGKT